jgi:hypothetical protein
VTIPRIVLWLSAAGFLGFGLAFALWPVPMAGITEIPLPTPTARIDYGATYGGFQLGFGIFLVICARRAGWLEPGLWAAAAALAGFASIRLLGVVLQDGPVATPIYVGLALELSGVGLNVWALRRLRQSNGSAA